MRRKLYYTLSAALLIVLISLSMIIDRISLKPEIKPQAVNKTVIKVTVTPTPTNTPTPTPKPNRVTRYYTYILKPYIDEIPLICYRLELSSLGRHFITAYSPQECGYNGSNFPKGWTTASDTICHRAEYSKRYVEPTTCAIDRKLYRFGDLFYIAEFDRVFIAEDTGSAVKNKHLDLFYENYSDVVSFPTGYYTVYSVTVEKYEVKAGDYSILNYIHTKPS